MSARSFKRGRARADAAGHRREQRRGRRASLAAGAAIGATVVFAPSASAATFEVDTLADPAVVDDCATGDCTLREAVADADANGEADTISFADGLSGTLRLLQGEIEVFSTEGISIEDTGTNEVTISGDADSSGLPDSGDSRIFNVAPYASLSISGLTLTNGYGDGADPYEAGGGAVRANYESSVSITDSELTGSEASFGGAIFSAGASVELTDSVVVDNYAPAGGGIFSTGEKYAPDSFRADGGGADAAGEATLVVTGSTVSDNDASVGGGIFSAGEKYQDEPAVSSLTTLTVSDSTISGNDAIVGGGSFSKYSDTDISETDISENAADSFGGVAGFAGDLAVRNSEISGNYAAGESGGVGVGKYGTLHLADSQVTGNEATYGAGVNFGDCTCSPYDAAAPGDSEITGTTISGNTAELAGGGVNVNRVEPGSSLSIEKTTISGNQATDEESYGGGMAIYSVEGDFELSNSTVSGNSADFGGGVAFDFPYLPDQAFARAGADGVAPGGSLLLANSTIAANAAGQRGGGIYLGSYDSGGGQYASAAVPLSSTIVADNTASGGPNDLEQETPVDVPGSFRLTNSLVETPGAATVTQNPAGASILGVDPALAALADNGGPTRTHLPANTSPAIDVGLANGLATDQRGDPRTVQLPPPDGAGDGTDIGSVEVQAAPTPSHTRALQRDEVPAGCVVPFDDAELALAGDNTSQTIEGSPGDDILRGWGGDDTVLGVGGNDCLTGDSDNDVVDGGSGDDFGIGGFGSDVLKGGSGSDEMRGAEDDDKIKLAAGDDKGVGGGGDDKVTGADGDDAVRGRFGEDSVNGQDGDDAVRGGGGDDLVKGGSGDNALRGGGGDDRIVLAKGSSNEVNCGKGDDTVTGAGRDDQIAANCEHVS